MRKMLLLLLLASPTMAQVSVSLSPVPHLQFLNNSGIPLANACVFTYAAGTTTPAATYIDSFGVSTNSNPILLDAGGFANIWLPNAAFKFKVVSAGGVNCASGVTQWTVDNISGVLGLLNLANTWTAANTFTQPVTITPNSNQLVIGAPGNQTTLNFPAPAGNIIQSMLSVADTYVGVAATQNLLNKTLTSPVLVGATGSLTNPVLSGVNVQVGATYTIVAGDEQKLIKFIHAGAVAVTLPQATTAGFGAGTVFHVTNGGSTVTITPTVSTIDGAATLVLATNQGADIYSDGANYFTQPGPPFIVSANFSGTAIMTVALIGSGACGAPVSVVATGVTTTDTISFSYNAAPAVNPAELVISSWPTLNTVNFQYCNPTAGGITPNAATLNWRVVR